MPTDEHKPAGHEGRVKPRTKRQVAGTVIATGKSTTKALIRLETGTVVEAAGAELLEDVFAVGAAANVYFDSADAMVGWVLTDHNIGVNLERSESE